MNNPKTLVSILKSHHVKYDANIITYAMKNTIRQPSDRQILATVCRYYESQQSKGKHGA